MELFKIFGTIDIKDGDAKAKLKEINDESGNLAKSLQDMGGRASKVGKKMSLGLTAPLVGVGVAAVKTAGDFEAGMSSVAALSGATGSDLQALEDIAREMGAKTKFSATEAAEGLQYMALAGWDTNQMIAGLEPSLLLAGAAGMELGTATDIVTDTMSMFGMEAAEATKMTDMLAYAQANSNTDVDMLGQALVNVGANANAMGYDLADTSALLGVFADQGLKGGRAGTTLSAIFRDMKGQAEDGAIAIGDKTVKIVDANGNYRDMVDILADVESATDGLTQAEKDNALSMTFGDQAIKGMNMALQAGSDNIAEFEEGIRGSDGAAKEMYDTMNDNLLGKMEELKSALSEAAISIGQALIPMVESVVKWINKWVDWYNELDEGTQQTILKIAALVAAIGPVLLIGGKLFSGIGKIIGIGTKLVGSWSTIISVAGTVAGGIGKTIGFLFSPAGMIMLGIAAVIAIGVLLWKNWDTIKEKANMLWESMTETFENVKNAIMTPINAAKDAVFDALEKIKGWFSNLKLSFPKLNMPKLPTFSLTGKFSIIPPSVPRVSVNWNKDGAIFTKPTIFDTAQGRQGVGEAGAEAVLPIEKLSGMMANTMDNLGYGNNGKSGGDIIQNITINTPDAISPSENARLMKNASRQLAMEWGN